MSLSEQILAIMTATNKTVGINDQLSALGMARSWIDNQKPIRWNPDQIEYPKRDQLAKDLVAVLETSDDRDEQIEALHEAREVITAPCVDPSMLGFQAGRHRLAKPGEKKKAAKEAEAKA